MSQIVPTQVVPSQTLAVVLDDQNCEIALYQKSTGLYADVSSNGVVLCTCVACLNLAQLVLGEYLGFSGNLVFMDQQGTDDPVFSGLGSRWILVYLAPGDLA